MAIDDGCGKILKCGLYGFQRSTAWARTRYLAIVFWGIAIQR